MDWIFSVECGCIKIPVLNIHICSKIWDSFAYKPSWDRIDPFLLNVRTHPTVTKFFLGFIFLFIFQILGIKTSIITYFLFLKRINLI